MHSVYHPRQSVDPIQGQPQRLTHIPQSRTRTVSDHHSGHPRPVSPVLSIKVLQNLLATFVLEVDVYVGRLVPLATHKSLEQDVNSLRIDRRDPQAVTDGRIGSRTAALTQDAPAASKPDQVPDRQEIRFILQLGNQPKFMIHQRSHLGRHTRRIPRRRTLKRQPPQMFPRSRPLGRQLLGILVLQLVQREIAPPNHLQAPLYRPNVTANQLDHLTKPLQSSLGIRLPTRSQSIQRAAVPDRCQDVGQWLTAGMVIQHIGCRDQRQTGIRRPGSHPTPTARIVSSPEQSAQGISAVAECCCKPLQKFIHRLTLPPTHSPRR